MRLETATGGEKVGELSGKQDFWLPGSGGSCRLVRRRSDWFPDFGDWLRAFLGAQDDCHRSRAELPLKDARRFRDVMMAVASVRAFPTIGSTTRWMVGETGSFWLPATA